MRRLLIACLLFAACSSETKPPVVEEAKKPAAPPPPTVAEAKALLETSAELGEFEFTNAGWSTPTVVAQMNEPTRSAAEDLEKAGWLRLSGGNVTLAPKAEGDKRFLMRPNGLLDVVPLAKKEMGEVTAVTPNSDGTAAVDFTWRWLPNEVGSSFTSGAVKERFEGDQRSRATLIWDGTSWSVLKIERPAA